ncbi:hypothetical protein [Acidicapsa acidisoli]|uniref:hypothetical protein n=1 Tax=Acidicapsa acidisoli TaxID=1615681 RepID=UPI0021E05AE0|nr:hypothetical protein [Acidicapsa acidisoli]
MKRKRRYTSVATLSAILFVASVYAEWGPWQSIGDGQVTVSFSQIKSDMCTWQIKNTGSTTLKTFEFSYTYTPADSASTQKTDKDILPYPLKPGAAIGGWTVYLAHTHRCPTRLATLKLERDN